MKRFLQLFLLFVLGTFWVRLAEPIVPMGLFIGAIYFFRKKSLNRHRVVALLLGAALGFFENGIYVQFYEGKLLAGASFELIVPAQSFKATDITWGEPEQSAKYYGETFDVAAIGDLDNAMNFPVTIKTGDGAVTQYLNITLGPSDTRVSQHCLYTDEHGRSAEAVSVSVDLPANSTEHGFDIVAPIEKTEWVRGKRCALEFAESSWILMRQKDVLRLYNTPDAYIELVPIQP